MDSTGLMKAYGYVAGEDTDKPVRLSEVTLVASAQELRKLATFLTHAAALKEKHGDRFGHEHFSDFDGAEARDLDIIVSK